MSSLLRFLQAQEDPQSGFEAALYEMRAGQKERHWIWYIFPQLAGLGSSSFARMYAIQSLAEAGDYLRHDTLRGRYLLITGVVAEQLRKGVKVVDLMGWDVDALKLVSSLTLFGQTAKRLWRKELGADLFRFASLTDEILSMTSQDGFDECAFTLKSFLRDPP
jgi:uncharacterized protein (DUF1810 family)